MHYARRVTHEASLKNAVALFDHRFTQMVELAQNLRERVALSRPNPSVIDCGRTTPRELSSCLRIVSPPRELLEGNNDPFEQVRNVVLEVEFGKPFRGHLGVRLDPSAPSISDPALLRADTCGSRGDRIASFTQGLNLGGAR